MTKYPASNKVSNFVKPHIKKGYYPGKLISVKRFEDSSGKIKEGKYGHQWIMEFAVYKKNQETDEPIEPIKYFTDESEEFEADLILATFPYYEYKDKKGEGFSSAITPNSKTTAILESLGWVFNEEGVDPEEYIGNWVDLNIDEYEYEVDGEKKEASTIKDISKYKGPNVKEVRDVKKKEPQKVSKQIKHEDLNPDEKFEKVEEINKKIENLKNLNKEGLLTDEGLKQAKENLEAQLEELSKK